MATIYNFPKLRRLNTFRERTLTLRGANAQPIDLTGASIVIEFRQGKKSGPLLRRLTMEDGISILNPTAGQIVLSAFSLDFPVGDAFYDCIMIGADGAAWTVFEGVQPVEQNVGQP